MRQRIRFANTIALLERQQDSWRWNSSGQVVSDASDGTASESGNRPKPTNSGRHLEVHEGKRLSRDA